MKTLAHFVLLWSMRTTAIFTIKFFITKRCKLALKKARYGTVLFS